MSKLFKEYKCILSNPEIDAQDLVGRNFTEEEQASTSVLKYSVKQQKKYENIALYDDWLRIGQSRN